MQFASGNGGTSLSFHVTKQLCPQHTNMKLVSHYSLLTTTLFEIFRQELLVIGYWHKWIHFLDGIPCQLVFHGYTVNMLCDSSSRQTWLWFHQYSYRDAVIIGDSWWQSLSQTTLLQLSWLKIGLFLQKCMDISKGLPWVVYYKWYLDTLVNPCLDSSWSVADEHKLYLS